MQTVQIQQINISDLQTIISETVRNEFKKLIPTPPPKDKPTYGTRKEVAEELKISLPILNEHTKSGVLPAYRIGGRVLYKWDEVFESVKLIQSLKYKRTGL